MENTNATSEDDGLSIHWDVPDETGTPAPEPSLTLPPDLFGPPGPGLAEDAPTGFPGDEGAPLVLDQLFGDEDDDPQGPPTAAAGAPLVVGDLFSTTTAVKTKPRLAPERTEVATRRLRRSFGSRRLWISGAVVAGVVVLSTLVNQPPDPSLDVRSAAQPDPAPTVTASTRPAPSTTMAPSSTTVSTAPSTTTAAEGGATLTTGAPATTAAPRATTAAPSPATTAAPPPAAPAPPTTAAAAEPDPVTTEPPPPDTTATTRRPRETVPPPTTAPPATSTTVEPEEIVDRD